MKISIFGTWYVGLVTGTCLAEVGHEVLCIDIDTRKIENLKKWNIPIYEPGLQALVERNTASWRLSFSTDMKKGIAFWKAIFSAVGTPPDTENGNKADLKYVYEVAKTFWEYVQEHKVLINKSTVPVWTAKECKKIIQRAIYEREKNIDFDVVSNPEFLREWSAINDFLVPERIVIWLQWETSKKIMREIYKPLKKEDVQIVWTDIISAEIIKYAANAFLATKISFINDIANFSKKLWGNISDISQGIGLDSRIGKSFLSAGIGYGGSCLPKDVRAFIETGKEYDHDFHIIDAAEKINTAQKSLCLDIIEEHFDALKDVRVTLWWLSFKPNTDDTRDAPARYIIDHLIEKSAEHISVYDPIALEEIKKDYSHHKNMSFHTNSYEALEESDVLILVTEWDEFRVADFKKMKKTMRGNMIIDGRNIWEKGIEEYGFQYHSIGR